MNPRSDSQDYHRIFLNDTPLLDVRSPIEFSKGAFPTACNIPLMSDAEREQVGICYKHAGQEAAIALGHRLVSGETKANRLQKWQDFTQKNPTGYLYCFRGGLRSRTVQEWLRQAGCDYPLVVGGYKAMRRFLLEQLEVTAPLLRLAGQTGSGKTELLQQLIQEGYPGIDLEKLANHRGSAFGRNPDDHQPTPINFENALAIDWLKVRHAYLTHPRPILIEDEGRAIGRLAQPLAFYNHFRQQPVVVLTAPFAERVDRILDEYVQQQRLVFQRLYGEHGSQHHRDFMLTALDRIRKRLGGVCHQQIRNCMLQAFESNSDILHRQWIETLLKAYYDPMYDYQLRQKKDQIVFSGNAGEVREFLNHIQPALT